MRAALSHCFRTLLGESNNWQRLLYKQTIDLPCVINSCYDDESKLLFLLFSSVNSPSDGDVLYDIYLPIVLSISISYFFLVVRPRKKNRSQLLAILVAAGKYRLPPTFAYNNHHLDRSRSMCAVLRPSAVIQTRRHCCRWNNQITDHEQLNCVTKH